MLTQLEQNGYNPIVYTSPQTWNDYYTQEKYNFSKYLLWVAHWTTEKMPMIPKDWKEAGKSYVYWNYTAQGRIDGIEGSVSLDLTN